MQHFHAPPQSRNARLNLAAANRQHAAEADTGRLIGRKGIAPRLGDQALYHLLRIGSVSDPQKGGPGKQETDAEGRRILEGSFFRYRLFGNLRSLLRKTAEPAD